MEQICVPTGAAVILSLPMLYAAAVIFAAVLGGVALLMAAAEAKKNKNK